MAHAAGWFRLVLLAAPLAAAGCLGREECVLERVETLPYEAGLAFQVETHNGTVEFEVDGARSDIECVTRLRATGFTEDEARERVERMAVAVDRARSGTLRLHVQYPDGERKANDGASITLRVPAAAGLHVRTSNGRIHVTGVDAPTTVETSNGEVRVEDHGGELLIATSNGDVEVEGVSGPLTAASSNGAIRVQAHPDRRQPLHLATSNGDITLILPGRPDATLTATTSNGRIHAPGADPKARRQTIQLGAGGNPCTLETSNGTISIHTE